MSFLATSVSTTGARGQFSGQLYRIQEDFSASKRIFLPPSCATLDRKASGSTYGNRHYMVGGHSSNIMVDEELRGLRQGIAAPGAKPTVSSGGGTTPQIGYTRFYDEFTGERGPLSEGTEFTGDLSRSWSSLPTEVPNEQIVMEGIATIAAGSVTGVGGTPKTNFGELRPGDRIANSADLTRWAQVRAIASQSSMTIDDTTMAGVGITLVAKAVSRVSHVELWLSVFGALPRFVLRVRIGTTSVAEATATLALGEAETVSFTVMPFGEFNLFYNDRQLIAGVEGHRDTVFLSAIGFPERYEGFKFITAYNEPIVGMFRYSDYVVLLCPDSSYRLQGYTLDDYVRTVLDPKIGGLGHHCNQVTENYALVPGRKGLSVFNGRFHQGISTRRSEWTTDYTDNRIAWERSFSVVNANDETYQFYPRYQSITIIGLKNYVYVGHYSDIASQAGGTLSSPEWFTDTHILETALSIVTTCAAYLVPSGTAIGKLYRGTADGKIYEEDESGTVAFDGTAIAAHMHFLGLPVDPGGGEGEGEGKKLAQCWSYVRSEQSTWDFDVWPGDEYSYPVFAKAPSGDVNNAVPIYTHPVAASLETKSIGGDDATMAARVVHEHLPKNEARGWTFVHRFHDPLNVVLIGLGGKYGPGRVSRNVHTLTNSA